LIAILEPIDQNYNEAMLNIRPETIEQDNKLIFHYKSQNYLLDFFI